MKPIITSLPIIFIVNIALAQGDDVTIDSTITGNQEQPNVLTIVPWKNADDISVIKQTHEEQLEQIFPHLEPAEFERRRLFSEQLTKPLPKQ